MRSFSAKLAQCLTSDRSRIVARQGVSPAAATQGVVQAKSACACGGHCPRCTFPASAAGSVTRPLSVQVKAPIEALSGVSLADVNVHYDSSEPQRLGALAYTRGADIHLAPGQERHLPHEAWHAVQQKQQRVSATTTGDGVPMNRDARLEAEADAMGARATRLPAAIDTSRSSSRSSPASRTGNVIQAQTKTEAAPLSADAEAARQEIELLSKPQNAMGRKGLRAKDVIAKFARAGVEIKQIEAYNWIKTGKINPYMQAADPQAAPSNFEPVRNQQIVDDWNAEMAKATGRNSTTGEVTTSGDGAQITGWVDDSSAAGRVSNPNIKRDPKQEKALQAMQAYDRVDRTKLIKVPALFSDKPADVAAIDKLRKLEAYVDDKDPSEAPVAAMYVIGKTQQAGTKTIRQFVGSGIIIENAAGTWLTMSADDLGSRTSTALAKLKLTSRKYAKSDVVGWFVPEKLALIGTMPGETSGDLRDAYDQHNDVKKQLLSVADQEAEGLKFALLGNEWMGADWHGAETYGYRWKEQTVLDENGHIKFQEKGGKRVKDKQGYDIPMTERVREEVPKGVSEASRKAQEKAYKIYAGNPDADRVRNKDHFTTCLVTASHILKQYGVDPAIFGGLMAAVHQAKVGGKLRRETEVFQYLKDTGAWIWGEPGFVPKQGDVFITGSYQDIVNVKEKTRGFWTFQHAGIIAKVMRNEDETYTLLTQDGGKGSSALGEDKTGYTIRNYNAETRLISGASPKMIIGVWRPGLLKAALEKMPAAIKESLSKTQQQSYTRDFGWAEDIYE